MADSAGRDVKPAEPPAFDPDPWGASPRWDPDAEQSVYDDRELDQERVPLARSIIPGDEGSD